MIYLKVIPIGDANSSKVKLLTWTTSYNEMLNWTNCRVIRLGGGKTLSDLGYTIEE